MATPSEDNNIEDFLKTEAYSRSELPFSVIHN
jgi:hypothetical protein